MLKNLSMLMMLLGLGLFAVGCEPTAEDVTEENIEAEGAHAEADATSHAAHEGTATPEEAADAQEEAADESQEAAETAEEAAGADGGETPPAE